MSDNGPAKLQSKDNRTMNAAMEMKINTKAGEMQKGKYLHLCGHSLTMMKERPMSVNTI